YPPACKCGFSCSCTRSSGTRKHAECEFACRFAFASPGAPQRTLNGKRRSNSNAMTALPKPFLTAAWHHLAMLNFEVDPAVLAKYLPAGTEIDFFRDKTYLSVVGFRFLNTKVLGLRIPFHRNFDEVNLRFYIKRGVDGQTRRGVAFLKELVTKRMVAFVARRF